MKKTLIPLMFFAFVGVSAPTFAADPSLHEVYQAADAGKMDDAQRMMREVLQAHPNSGKAHYVEAELLARQGQLKQAAGELASAEKLAPGLPFANAQSVARLRETLTHHSTSAVQPVQHPPAAQPAYESGVPWGMLFMGLGLIAFIVWATRFMARRNAQGGVDPAQSGVDAYHRPVISSTPFGGSPQGFAAPGASGSASAAAAPGLGSQMLGGLATGAAVGAGVVAGEALLHHFLDGRKAVPSNEQAFPSFETIPSLPSTAPNDMGGNDFGVADNSSWDDNSSGGDSDWN